MPSSYAGFPVTVTTIAGVTTRVGAGVVVAVRADGAGTDVTESPLTTNSDGEIVGGTLSAISAGTLVHFRVQNYNGLAESISQITT